MKWFDLAMLARPLELVLMLAIFVFIVWRAWSPSRRREQQEHAMIPLRDDPAAAASAFSAREAGGAASGDRREAGRTR